MSRASTARKGFPKPTNYEFSSCKWPTVRICFAQGVTTNARIIGLNNAVVEPKQRELYGLERRKLSSAPGRSQTIARVKINARIAPI
jgi:hypothetical protein